MEVHGAGDPGQHSPCRAGRAETPASRLWDRASLSQAERHPNLTAQGGRSEEVTFELSLLPRGYTGAFLSACVPKRGLEPIQEVTFQIQTQMRAGGIYPLCFSEQQRHRNQDSVSHGCGHLTQSCSAPETLRPVEGNQHRIFTERRPVSEGSNQIKIWNPSRPGEIKSHPPKMTGALNKKVTPQWEKNNLSRNLTTQEAKP